MAHAGQRGLAIPAATGVALQDEYLITGNVSAANTSELLVGATVRIKGSTVSVLTDEKGAFRIRTKEPEGALIISFLGYKTTEFNFNRNQTVGLIIHLEPNNNQLEEVQVSTGYQILPKERATGSFVQIDNELLNRSVSTDVISRLKGVTPSLAFDERAGGEPKLSIRGRSTIFANDQPLIVLDNFPYEGDINSINPNDIENISILRDAAAASIWGVRAGNGVIVITTKKGQQNRPVSIAFNANVTTGAKPNLFYEPKMSSTDFIGLEQYLFDRGYYNSILNNKINPVALSPVVELLAAERAGEISNDVLENVILQLQQNDVRNDLRRHFYRESFNQQYALEMRGGTEKNTFYFSLGHDNNRYNRIGEGYVRTNFSTKHTLKLTDKLQLDWALFYTIANTSNNPNYANLNMGGRQLPPYTSLVDELGNAQAVAKDFRLGILNDVVDRGYLNWQYKPYEEIFFADNVTKANDIRGNMNISYELVPNLHLEAKYQYQKQGDNNRNLQSLETYFTRDLLNRFTTASPEGDLIRNIPIGDILNFRHTDQQTHNGRLQLNYNFSNLNHSWDMLGGFEVREVKTDGYYNRYYGYDVGTGTSLPVNYDILYQRFPSGSLRIPRNEGIVGTIDRFRSYYLNGAYTYKGKYVASLSGRIDQSNLFGVRANQRSVPLWSAGLKWNLSDEPFYRFETIPKLSLRASYGFNGNLDNSVTAYTTAIYLNDFYTGLRYANVITPPNPNLRMEKIAMANIGVSFTSINDRLSGTVEYYHKKGTDLLGEGLLNPTVGMSSYRGNVASMVASGLDLTLSLQNLKGKFGWQTDFFFNYSNDRITEYEIQSNSNFFADASLRGGTELINPIVGKPLFGIYSYKWAGLDGQTGDPLGYLNDQPSADYARISSSSTIDSLQYHGRATPAINGGFRNTFTFKNRLSISLNFTYRFDYYFRRNSIRYSTLYSSYITHSDYGLRWQRPGDEQHTNVPALVYPANANRDNFYTNAATLIDRGDHIRLQDLQISYTLPLQNSVFKSMLFYLYANNIGILWRANKHSLDPEVAGSVLPMPRTYAIGLKVSL